MNCGETTIFWPKTGLSSTLKHFFIKKDSFVCGLLSKCLLLSIRKKYLFFKFDQKSFHSCVKSEHFLGRSRDIYLKNIWLYLYCFFHSCTDNSCGHNVMISVYQSVLSPQNISSSMKNEDDPKNEDDSKN